MFGAGTACVVCPVDRILFLDEVDKLSVITLLTSLRGGGRGGGGGGGGRGGGGGVHWAK